MSVELFNNYTTWTVPAGTGSVQIKCVGEKGGDGDTNLSYGGCGGGNGRTVTGTLSTSPGDVLTIEIADGGNGRYRSELDVYADAGNGGDAGVVYHNGTSRSDVVIAASGGGGGGAAQTGYSGDSGCGSGGNHNSGGSGASASVNDINMSVSGGSGGALNSVDGENGSSDDGRGKYTDSESAAASGGGGAGYKAGEAGESDVVVYDYGSLATSYGFAMGGGGGGGRSTTRGVSSASSTSSSSTDANVELTFTSNISWTPNLTAYEEHGRIYLNWFSANHYGSDDIFRGGDKIDTIDASATGYVDSSLNSEGTYQYDVVAKNDYTATDPASVTQDLHLAAGKMRKNGQLVSAAANKTVVNGSEKKLTEAFVRDANGDLRKMY